jgi:hypothetical protein
VLDNFSLRLEIYYDAQGQRTGTSAIYWQVVIGWQHWFSPQAEVRPEIGYYKSNRANASSGCTPRASMRARFFMRLACNPVPDRMLSAPQTFA